MTIKKPLAGAAIIIAALGAATLTQDLAAAESGSPNDQFSGAEIEIPTAWKINEPGWRR
jgi:hypothetical protein